MVYGKSILNFNLNGKKLPLAKMQIWGNICAKLADEVVFKKAGCSFFNKNPNTEKCLSPSKNGQKT